MEVSGKLHAPDSLLNRYPLDRRLGGPQSRSGRGGEDKNSQPCRESNPTRQAGSLETILTELPRHPKSVISKGLKNATL
jgi:hypothetical protein